MSSSLIVPRALAQSRPGFATAACVMIFLLAATCRAQTTPQNGCPTDFEFSLTKAQDKGHLRYLDQLSQSATTNGATQMPGAGMSIMLASNVTWGVSFTLLDETTLLLGMTAYFERYVDHTKINSTGMAIPLVDGQVVPTVEVAGIQRFSQRRLYWPSNLSRVSFFVTQFRQARIVATPSTENGSSKLSIIQGNDQTPGVAFLRNSPSGQDQSQQQPYQLQSADSLRSSFQFHFNGASYLAFNPGEHLVVVPSTPIPPPDSVTTNPPRILDAPVTTLKWTTTMPIDPFENYLPRLQFAGNQFGLVLLPTRGSCIHLLDPKENRSSLVLGDCRRNWFYFGANGFDGGFSEGNRPAKHYPVSNSSRSVPNLRNADSNHFGKFNSITAVGGLGKLRPDGSRQYSTHFIVSESFSDRRANLLTIELRLDESKVSGNLSTGKVAAIAVSTPMPNDFAFIWLASSPSHPRKVVGMTYNSFNYTCQLFVMTGPLFEDIKAFAAIPNCNGSASGGIAASGRVWTLLYLYPPGFLAYNGSSSVPWRFTETVIQEFHCPGLLDNANTTSEPAGDPSMGFPKAAPWGTNRPGTSPGGNGGEDDADHHSDDESENKNVKTEQAPFIASLTVGLILFVLIVVGVSIALYRVLGRNKRRDARQAKEAEYMENSTSIDMRGTGVPNNNAALSPDSLEPHQAASVSQHQQLAMQSHWQNNALPQTKGSLIALNNAELLSTVHEQLERQKMDTHRGVEAIPTPTLTTTTSGQPDTSPRGLTVAGSIIVDGVPNVESVHNCILDWKFRKIKLVGRGATGSVYSCLLVDGSTIALKEIALRPQEAEREIAKLQQEMSLMRQLHHPNVLQYYGALYDNTDMKLLLFTEYVQGGSLGDLVRSMDGPLADETARVYMRQVVEGLQFLHSKGVMHRDLKADNVLRSLSGAVKIADFGASRMIDLQRATSVVASTMIGTPVFMAPEVLNGTARDDDDPAPGATGTPPAENYRVGYGRKADIWSVGILAAELVNQGRVPWPSFHNPGQAFLHISSGALPIIPSCATPTCADFIRACCVSDPRQRPTATALLQHPWLCLNTNSSDRPEAATPADIAEVP